MAVFVFFAFLSSPLASSHLLVRGAGAGKVGPIVVSSPEDDAAVVDAFVFRQVDQNLFLNADVVYKGNINAKIRTEGEQKSIPWRRFGWRLRYVRTYTAKEGSGRSARNSGGILTVSFRRGRGGGVGTLPEEGVVCP